MNVPLEDPVVPGEPQSAAATPTPAETTREPSAAVAAASERDAARRRRLAEQIVAGMLPETTSDERPSGSGEPGYPEQWYHENRPPHHG